MYPLDKYEVLQQQWVNLVVGFLGQVRTQDGIILAYAGQVARNVIHRMSIRFYDYIIVLYALQGQALPPACNSPTVIGITPRNYIYHKT